MKKYIFFDIDGTLTGVKKPGHIYESTKEAIRLLQENGHFVALATGRAAFRAKEFQKLIQIPNMVCEGGNQVIIHHETISYEAPNQEIMHRIYEEALRKEIGIAVSLEDSRYRISPNHRFIEDAGDFHAFMDVEIIPDFILQKDHIVRRLFVSLTPDRQHQLSSIKEVGVMHYGDASFLIVEPDDKYKGIRKVIEHFKGNPKDVVVFGDGLNDRKMFQEAPCSIAMGNAIDELKQLASYVTKDSDDDGIYHACKQFGWI